MFFVRKNIFLIRFFYFISSNCVTQKNNEAESETKRVWSYIGLTYLINH